MINLMASEEPERNDGEETGSADGGQPAQNRWRRRLIIAGIALVVIVVIYLMMQLFLPSWWARRIGVQVDGDTESGILWGGFYGFVFTIIPLLLIVQSRRRWVPWQGKLFLVAAAVLVAAPNWLTLVVVLGNSDAARSGRAALDADAPGFRMATLMGVIAAVAVVAIFLGSMWLLARRKRQIAELRNRIDRGDS